MRYGFFGGSFDPPHLGHVIGCLWALESGEIDRVLLVPVARHAFGKKQGATFGQRLEMCRLAVRHLGESVEVSDIENHLPGVNYTRDTLAALSGKLPGSSFRLIVGSDVAGEISKWKSVHEILRMAPLLELPRPTAGETVVRPDVIPAISSSLVREAIANQDPILPRLVGYSVRQYIQTHGLYTQEEGSSEP